MRARQVVALVVTWAGVAVLGGACSVIFSLDGFDQGTGGAPYDGGSTGGAPGSPDGPLDAPPDDGPLDAPPDVSTDPCTGKADGTVVGGDVTMRCCGGHPTSITTNSNCGVCGIVCASGQTCKPQGMSPTAYQCTGCNHTGGSMSCWSNCCALSLDMADGVCAPSSCGVSSHCCTSTCPSGTCQWFEGDKNNYCTYEHVNLPNQC